MKNWIIFGASALVVAGCGSGGGGSYKPEAVKTVEPAKVAPGEEKSLYPLAVGNQWTYTLTQSGTVNGAQRTASSEAVFKVTAIKPVGDGVQANIEVSIGGTLSEKQVWLVDSKGIFQMVGGAPAITFTPSQPQILFPPETGRKFSWKGVGPVAGQPTPDGRPTPMKPGSISASYEILGPQTVDTDMGPISAIAVQSSATMTVNGKQVSTPSITWWAPKVGLVRFVTNNTILKLKTYSAK